MFGVDVTLFLVRACDAVGMASILRVPGVDDGAIEAGQPNDFRDVGGRNPQESTKYCCSEFSFVLNVGISLPC